MRARVNDLKRSETRLVHAGIDTSANHRGAQFFYHKKLFCACDFMFAFLKPAKSACALKTHNVVNVVWATLVSTPVQITVEHSFFTSKICTFFAIIHQNI